MKVRATVALVALALSPAIAAPASASAATMSFRRPASIHPVLANGRSLFPNSGAGLTRIGGRLLSAASLGNTPITFRIATPMRNSNALFAYAQAASNPRSAYYRQWLTPDTIASSFGTPVAQYNATAAYFAGLGLYVHPWKTRTFMTVTGVQRQVEAALGTKFGIYAYGKQRVYAPYRTLSLPAQLGVSGISSVSNFQHLRTNALPGAPPEQLSGGFSNARVNGVTPAQLAEAYDLNEAYAKGYTGKGINLGIIGTGPISPNDFPNYRTLFNIPGSSTVTIAPVSVDGDTTPPAVTGQCTTGTGGAAGSSTAPVPGCNPEDIEAQLDTEQTASLAHDANVLFYLAYNGSACETVTNPIGGTCVGSGIPIVSGAAGATGPLQGLDLADDEILEAVDDNKADVLSLSYGGCENLENGPVIGGLTPVPQGNATGADPTMFAELASEGVATFVSSGDSGSAGCQRVAEGGADEANVSYPASDPNVVAVGGTTTPIGADGRLTGPITNWGQQTKSGGAAGAGFSMDFTQPSFQSGQPTVASACSGTNSTAVSTGSSALELTPRCVPDIALNADPFSGPAVLFDSTRALGGPSEEPVGGTSASAPDTAAMWAIVLSACEQVASCAGKTSGVPKYRLGDPNYLLYPILGTSGVYHSVFYDIVYGNDAVPTTETALVGAEAGTNTYTVLAPGSTTAGAGYDVTSGLGFPLGYQLLKYIVPGAK